jgi:hypothetical protein
MKFIWAFRARGEDYFVLGETQEDAIAQIHRALPRGTTIVILNYVPLARGAQWARDYVGL